MKTFNQFINESKETTINKDRSFINGQVFHAGDKVWRNEEGEFHREDGPAIEYKSDRKEWYINGLRHRDDGPAIEHGDIIKFWYKNGIPVKKITGYQNEKIVEYDEEGKEKKITYKNGDTEYLNKKGQHHKLDGPAIEFEGGHKLWRINGKPMEQWKDEEIKLLIANDNLKNLFKYPDIIKKIKEYSHLLNSKDRLLLDIEWKNKI